MASNPLWPFGRRETALTRPDDAIQRLSPIIAASPGMQGYLKSIWGSDFQQLMGINPYGNAAVDEVEASPTGYNRAYTVTDVYVAEEIRRKGISAVPLRCYEIMRDGSRGDSIDHDVLAVIDGTFALNSVVEAYLDGTGEVMGASLAWMDLHGHTTWKVATSGKGKPTEIFPLLPQSYRVKRDPVRNFGGVVVTAANSAEKGSGTVTEYLPPEKLAYFSTFSASDPLMGTSKIQVLRDLINLELYAVNTNMEFFKNSMRPDWILSGNWANTEENIGRIRRTLKKWFTGDNARHPLILGEGAQAHLLTMNAKDAEWLGQQRFSGEKVTAVFGVPVIYLNNWERATYSNVDAARAILWESGIQPDADYLAKSVTRQFFWKFWPEARRRYELGFDYSEVKGLQEDSQRIAERVVRLSDALSVLSQRGQITANQALPIYRDMWQQVGVDPALWPTDVPLGDTFHAPINNVPVEQLGVQANIDIMAARGQNPELIRNVPGAEQAEQGVQEAVGRMTRQMDQAQQARQEAAERLQAHNQAQQSPPGNEPPQNPPQPDESAQPRPVTRSDVEDIVYRALRQEPVTVDRYRVVVKGPHPLRIRDVRLADVHDKTVRKLKAHFQKLQREVLHRVRGKSKDWSQDYLYNQANSQQGLWAIISPAIQDSAEAAYGAAAEDYGLSVAFSDSMPWLDAYMGARLPLIKGIDDTTVTALRETLLNGAQAGETIDELAQRVTDVFDAAMGYRAEMIARTETIQAYGKASLAAYREAGIQKAQLYDGTGDEECAERNGEIVDLDEAEQMMGDEHPNGTLGYAPYIEVAGLPGADESDVVEAAATLVRLKAQPYRTTKQPQTHNHSTDEGGTPVIVFDLHRTLTPASGYPLQPPFPGVQEALDKWASQGVCLHICTAALAPTHPQQILDARLAQTVQWITTYNLPIPPDAISGKVGAHLYIDDRMVQADGDWARIATDVEAQLDKRAPVGDDGIRRLIVMPESGSPIEDFPEEMAPDQPRGYSTPVVDIDLHRCTLTANSSANESGPRPGAVDAINALYDAGYTVHLSCAGWDPASHSPTESQERLRGLQRQVRMAGIRYDEIVSKDHPTVCVDDKGFTHTDWATDLPQIVARMETPNPEDEVTGQPDTTTVIPTAKPE